MEEGPLTDATNYLRIACHLQEQGYGGCPYLYLLSEEVEKMGDAALLTWLERKRQDGEDVALNIDFKLKKR